MKLKDVEEDGSTWVKPHKGESQTPAVADFGAAASTSDVKCPKDMFLTAGRMAGKLTDRYGKEVVRNLLNNLNKVNADHFVQWS